MKKRYKIILGVTAIVIFGLTLKKMFSAVPVTPVQIENVIVAKTVSASGSVVSAAEADLSFQTPGQISQIFVNEGQEVSKGAAIAAIINTGQAADLQSVRSSLDAAEKDLEIYIQTYATNVSAAGGEDEYWLNVRKLEDLVNRAQANYQSQLASYGKTYVYAPFAGTVVDIYKDAGESAAFGDPVVRIADLGNLIFEVTIDQEDFGLLEPGQNVEIILDSYEGRVFSGVLGNLPSYANPSSEEFTIKITLNQESEKPALLGMTGDARIITEKTGGSVQALTFDQVMDDESGNSFVWIAENGILRKFNVEIGLEGDLYTEIKTDMSGKTVVTARDSQTELKDGIKVKVVE